MKLKILIILIIIISALFLFVIFKQKKKEDIKDIKSIEFRYTNGYMINSDTYYKLECNDNCVLQIKRYGSSNKEEYNVDNCVLKDIEKILNKYNVSSWDGFNKSDKNVLDGDSFSMNITYDNNKSIYSSGYMMYPNNYKYVKEELETLFNSLTNSGDEDLKPIIYLYPEETMNIKVELGNPDKLTVTYPKYKDYWDIEANPDGTLIDKKTERLLYSLFWEGINTESNGIKEDGFIVRGEDALSFLEEKLEILGLNYKEQEEFIIYWLPKLERNKYNYIRFETIEEQNNNMPLIITPKPDTLIRINMEYMPLDEIVEIKEQQLTKVERKGYTVVEWGGTTVNSRGGTVLK